MVSDGRGSAPDPGGGAKLPLHPHFSFLFSEALLKKCPKQRTAASRPSVFLFGFAKRNKKVGRSPTVFVRLGISFLDPSPNGLASLDGSQLSVRSSPPIVRIVLFSCRWLAKPTGRAELDGCIVPYAPPHPSSFGIRRGLVGLRPTAQSGALRFGLSLVL